jgi:hypothetical protein
MTILNHLTGVEAAKTGRMFQIDVFTQNPDGNDVDANISATFTFTIEKNPALTR